jgi:2-dehydropantoate 2-reductase
MKPADDCRILVLGEGVIGSVYAARLHAAGIAVALFATDGAPEPTHLLQLEDAESGQETILRLPTSESVAPATPFDLILVCVRAEQLMSTLPTLAALKETPDVLFLGNLGGHMSSIVDVLGERAMFGFPSIGGRRDGNRIVYVNISQQLTMVGEMSGSISERARWIRDLLRRAGFRTAISGDIHGWLIAHAAFIVPIAVSLSRHNFEPAALAADPGDLKRMMRASRASFVALSRNGNHQIPRNLLVLYVWMPIGFAVSYWARVFRSPRGELWFAAHCRAAPTEIQSMTEELLDEIRSEHLRAPALISLIQSASSSPTLS